MRQAILLPGTRLAIYVGHGKPDFAYSKFAPYSFFLGSYGLISSSGLTLVHMDTLQSCPVRTEGLTYRERREPPLVSVVRIPVHKGAKVTDTEGILMSPFNTTSPPEPIEVNEKQNISQTIVEWRIVLVVAFGCKLGGSETSAFESNSACNRE